MTIPAAIADEVRRACLEIQVRHPGLCRLMLTGPVGGEGTTTVAAVQARVLAALLDAPVVVVDAHFDAPALHLRFGLKLAPGLRDWDPADPGRGIVALADDPRVAVLPAGPQNGATLYSLQSAGRLAQLAAHLRQNFAWVLWDAPPLNTSPEARLLAGHVDGVLAVLEADGTRLEALSQFNEVVAQCGAPLLGSIMNRDGRFSIGARPTSRALRPLGT